LTVKKTSKAKSTKASKAAVVASDGQVIAATTTKAKPAVVAKASKAAKAPKAKPQSPTAVIRELLAADPTLEPMALAALLAKRGMQPPATTINTVRADFLGCLKALQAAGQLKLH
jgi:hypothetical protein